MLQRPDTDMLNSSVYVAQKGYEAPVLSGLSKQRKKLIVRVPTQESLLPSDLNTRKIEMLSVAKQCELYYEKYFPSEDEKDHTRVEFVRDGENASLRDRSPGEEPRRGMPIAVYENGELTMS